MNDPFAYSYYFIGIDYPYITALLPDNSIEIHNIDTQAIVQVIPPPAAGEDRRKFVKTFNGFLVPSLPESKKLQKVAVPLRRKIKAKSHSEETEPDVPPADL